MEEAEDTKWQLLEDKEKTIQGDRMNHDAEIKKVEEEVRANNLRSPANQKNE